MLIHYALMQEIGKRPASIPGKIARIVAEEFGVTVQEMRSRSRVAMLVDARFAGMELTYQYTRLSLGAVGGVYGGRDHSSVIHARRAVVVRRQLEPTYAAMFDRAESRVRLALGLEVEDMTPQDEMIWGQS